MKVAIAHDYLTQFGGAERVVLSLMKAFPDAPVYTTLYEPDLTYGEFRDADVRVSPLNRLRPFRVNHRLALPVLPGASAALRVDADVVVASSSGWAHRFPTRGSRLVYCHSPARWLYMPDQYLGDAGLAKRAALTALGPGLRRWDLNAANHADRYIANSTVVQRRIKAVYGIDAGVIFPPQAAAVDAIRTRPAGLPIGLNDGFHLIVSRLLPYKNVDVALEAFAGMPQESLVVVGRGPLAGGLRSHAPRNVTLLEGVSDQELRWLYANASALIAPSHEDFGLSVIEAAAFGTPAIALHSGGYLDTVRDGVSGLFFDRSDVAAIQDAVRRRKSACLPREKVVAHADTFGEQAFIAAIRREVDDLARSGVRMGA